MLLIGCIDVDVIGLLAIVRSIRFITLILVKLLRLWLLKLSCGSTARVVRHSTRIAAASILTNIILETFCIGARGIHLIIGDDALVRKNPIVIDLFTLLMPGLIVLLLWAFRQVLGRLLHDHWVLFDA